MVGFVLLSSFDYRVVQTTSQALPFSSFTVTASVHLGLVQHLLGFRTTSRENSLPGSLYNRTNFDDGLMPAPEAVHLPPCESCRRCEKPPGEPLRNPIAAGSWAAWV
jgi:hypothetical protein